MTPITPSNPPASVQCATVTVCQEIGEEPQWLYVSVRQDGLLHLQTTSWSTTPQELVAVLSRLQDALGVLMQTPGTSA